MNAIWDNQRILSPSLITLDMCNLESQIRELESSGIKVLHIDILDGHFSPSMPLGFETVKQLRAKTDLIFDCHVMTQSPEFFVDELIKIGVEQILFHIEEVPHIDGLLNKIHNAGIRAGVALKPSTPLTTLEYVLEKCDTVMLMLINPGYASSAGEKQVVYGRRKIEALRKMIESRGLNTKIEIDGRVSKENLEHYGNGLVDIFVLGTTCFSRNDIQGSLAELMQ